jgi:choline/ethanolamine kinase
MDEFEALTHPAQAVLYLVQGQLGYGPKLYGVFEGGRLEEYIPSSTLNDDHLQDPTIRKEVAQRIARYHALDLPFTRENKSGLDIVLASYRKKFVKEDFLTNETVKESGADLDFLTSLDVEAEAKWLYEMQEKVGGRIAFCLRDLNRLNCLVRDEPDKHNERVTMIDYEASVYTWRGYDIGCHFSMWTFDLHQPEFKAKLDFPSEEIQREYIRNYLEETKKLAYFEFDEKIDSEDHLLMEAHLHGMLGMFFFAIFTLTAYKKDNPFVTKDMIHLFLRCSERGLKFYMERKQLFIEKYQL